MRKIKKALSIVLVTVLLISLAACSPAQPAPAGSDPAEEVPYHIGIVTLSYAQTEDEIRGAEDLIKEFGNSGEGGMITHIVLPDNFAEEMETVITNIAGLADDPLMKAIVVNPAVPGTAAAFEEIRGSRDDILLLAGGPQDDPNLITAVADIVVDSDNFSRGYYDIVRAQKMGATKFVHLSFPRHMSMETLSRRRELYEQVCADLGIEFIFETVPDPAAEAGTSGAQIQVFEMMPQLIDRHGTDAAYFTTNAALHEPIIKRVQELGGIFVCTDDVSPLVGWPTAYGVDLSAEAGNWPAIVEKIEAAVVEAGGGGRMAGYAYSLIYSHSVGLVHLAKNMLDGAESGNTLDDVVAAYSALTPGCDWKSSNYVDAATGEVKDNFYLLAQDTYIFGEGYSGVMANPIPPQYTWATN